MKNTLSVHTRRAHTGERPFVSLVHLSCGGIKDIHPSTLAVVTFQKKPCKRWKSSSGNLTSFTIFIFTVFSLIYLSFYKVSSSCLPNTYFSAHQKQMFSLVFMKLLIISLRANHVDGCSCSADGPSVTAVLV